MLTRRHHQDGWDVIVDGEGEIQQWIEKGDPTPGYVTDTRENPDPEPGTEHRAKNPAPSEIVELRGERDNPGKHGEKHGEGHGDKDDEDHHSSHSEQSTMARENITENIGEDFTEVLVTSGSALGGEMIATELSTLVDQSLLSGQSATVRKSAAVGVPFVGALATMALTDGQEWAQAGSIGMALAGVRNGLKWALPNSSPINVGQNSSADLSGSKSLASRAQSLQGRSLQGRSTGGHVRKALRGRQQRRQRTRQRSQRPARQSKTVASGSRSLNGRYTSETAGTTTTGNSDEMEGIG